MLAKIADTSESDRVIGERLHAIFKANAPALAPKLWYGMPRTPRTARSSASSRAQKFKTRYATLGFSDQANLDDGAMWPTTLVLTELTPVGEARIGAFVKQAVS